MGHVPTAYCQARFSAISNLLFGELGDLLKGTLPLQLFVCKRCGKAEFFVTDAALARVREHLQEYGPPASAD